MGTEPLNQWWLTVLEGRALAVTSKFFFLFAF